ncbi:MAG: GTPase Era [Bryobacteraceae bacterium]|nr:GTPase Era [Bryobacteraceae bacterium]
MEAPTEKIKNSFRSGFVSLVGRPNAGKSTLLNAFVGSHVAIVTDKPQTTRINVQGIWTSDESQVIFLDTPGIHKGESLYNRRMMQEVRSALEQRDLILYVADATMRFTSQEDKAIDLVRKSGTPAFLVLNKVDKLAKRSELLALLERYSKQFNFQEYVPVSALKGEMMDTLRELIVKYLPEGPEYFPPDQVTDQPERYLAAELIREKILRATHQEVPHSIAVFIDHWEETPKTTRIAATIYVERAGQKGIIIGTGGQMLRQIGTEAREDIEEMLGTHAFLELFVKVKENWRENPLFLSQLDWKVNLAQMTTPVHQAEAQDGEDGPVVLP